MFDSDLHTYINNLLSHKENARQLKIVAGECVNVTVTSYLVSIVYVVHLRTVKNKLGGKDLKAHGRPERKHAEDPKENMRKT